MESEIWKDIKGWEGLYQVSNFGRVKSLGFFIKSKLNNVSEVYRKGRILKQPLNTYGYPFVNLSSNGKHKSISTHRLVAIQFIQNPNAKLEVNHKNGIKTDNNVNNLEWCTSSENSKHSFKNGLQVSTKGEDRSHSKLNNEKVENIRNSYIIGISVKNLSEKYSVGKSCIYDVINRKTWSHIE